METKIDTQTLLRSVEAALIMRGSTVKDFCEELGIHRATWQRWKGGLTEMTPVAVRAVRSWLDEKKGDQPS